MSKKPYYLTTAIAYTSGKPHIGNTYEIVLADAIVRYKRFQGYDVRFQTGTDEHGQKIELKAQEAGITPKEFVDGVSTEIKRIWDLMNTSYDRFIRTTDEEHEKQVQKIFKKLYDKGDIYKVPAQGGTAVQLTTQASYEANPVWSPDGKQIAFASDRNGNFDLFIMPADGGTAQRLTYHSASEIPSAFTPDGKFVLFSASIQDPAGSALFPTGAMTELYKVPAGGGRTEQVLATPAEWVCFDKSGKNFLYQDRKGFEDEWRKHHTSSITRDIWLYNTQSGKHTNLTNREGEDRNPVYAPDGNSVYFLSERNGGSFNVYNFSLNTSQTSNVPQEVKAITTFRTHPVRFLSISDKGTLCYTYDGELYTQEANARPKKVNVELVRDDEKEIASLKFSQGADSASVSPDGKQVAFIVRGDVFVTSTDYTTTKQITNTPGKEAAVSFAPDNRTLVYASERTGNWQLYTAKIARKEEANFPNATLIEEEVLLPSKTVERAYPQYSPDGKELAFIEDRNR